MAIITQNPYVAQLQEALRNNDDAEVKRLEKLSYDFSRGNLTTPEIVKVEQPKSDPLKETITEYKRVCAEHDQSIEDYRTMVTELKALSDKRYALYLKRKELKAKKKELSQ